IGESLADSASKTALLLNTCLAIKLQTHDHQQTPHFMEAIKKIEALTANSDVQLVNWVEPDEYSYVYTAS
ncbi:hypothetical protein, partial [Pseudomonas rubra]